MNEIGLQKQIENDLAQAGIMPLVDRDKSQFLTDLPDWFAEIVLTDATRQADAEQILNQISAGLHKSGTNLEVVVRSLWDVAKVWYAGPARTKEGGLRTALDFRAQLRSGERVVEARVDVTIAALMVLRQHLGKEDIAAVGWSPQKGDVDEQDISAAVTRYLEIQVSQGGTSYWDPLLESHLDLNEAAMSYVLGYSTALQELRTAINDAFSEPVLPSFVGGLSASKVSMADFERVLPDLSNLLGGAYKRGQRFSVSARELFDSLTRGEQELLRRYFLVRARRSRKEQPDLVQEYPSAFANL
ncbi:MAG TPA: hypothetical protein VMD99_02185 [Terriglobales bacterium]|nr:hypothetical protein [Terriglobales bacterium]